MTTASTAIASGTASSLVMAAVSLVAEWCYRRAKAEAWSLMCSSFTAAHVDLVLALLNLSVSVKYRGRPVRVVCDCEALQLECSAHLYRPAPVARQCFVTSSLWAISPAPTRLKVQLFPF